MSNSFFKQNEHGIERVLRVLVGIFLLALVFVGPQTPFGWIGLIPIATGLSGVCPLYSIFGFSTCAVSSKRSLK